jgi:hypothetical protein
MALTAMKAHVVRSARPAIALRPTHVAGARPPPPLPEMGGTRYYAEGPVTQRRMGLLQKDRLEK